MWDSFQLSAAAVNVRKVSEWIGISCSARFIHLHMHPSAIESAATGPIVWHITYYVSTNNYAGFQTGALSEGSIMTDVCAWNKFVFDWEMVIVSV
jgi:hypothetical protein